MQPSKKKKTDARHIGITKSSSLRIKKADQSILNIRSRLYLFNILWLLITGWSITLMDKKPNDKWNWNRILARFQSRLLMALFWNRNVANHPSACINIPPWYWPTEWALCGLIGFIIGRHCNPQLGTILIAAFPFITFITTVTFAFSFSNPKNSIKHCYCGKPAVQEAKTTTGCLTSPIATA